MCAYTWIRNYWMSHRQGFRIPHRDLFYLMVTEHNKTVVSLSCTCSLYNWSKCSFENRDLIEIDDRLVPSLSISLASRDSMRMDCMWNVKSREKSFLCLLWWNKTLFQGVHVLILLFCFAFLILIVVFMFVLHLEMKPRPPYSNLSQTTDYRMQQGIIFCSVKFYSLKSE